MPELMNFSSKQILLGVNDPHLVLGEMGKFCLCLFACCLSILVLTGRRSSRNLITRTRELGNYFIFGPIQYNIRSQEF